MKNNLEIKTIGKSWIEANAWSISVFDKIYLPKSSDLVVDIKRLDCSANCSGHCETSGMSKSNEGQCEYNTANTVSQASEND